MYSYQSIIKSNNKILPGIFIIIFLLMPAVYQAQNLLNQPQKIVIDKQRSRYLVSNFVTGDIVQIDSNGVQSYFVEGAGFIDGMEIVGDTVYGASGGIGGVGETALKGYDLETGQLVMNVIFPGIINISSIITDSSGYLYLSESFGGSKILKLRISDQAWWLFVDGQGLQNPNGMIYEKTKNRILVCADEASPPIKSISLTDSSVSTFAITALDGMDGITKDKFGSYYITGYYIPGVYRFDSTFSNPPEMILRGNNIVYPTYDADNHSILLTHYNDNDWSNLSLSDPLPPTMLTAAYSGSGIKLQWKNPSCQLDGQSLNDFDKVLIYRDGNLIDSLLQSSADTSQIREYLDDIEGYHSYYLQVQDNEVPPNNSQSTEELNMYGGSILSDYSVDFESGIGVMHRTGSWDLTNQISSSGQYSITDSPDGDYQKNQNTYILTPPTIIGPNSSLQFDHIGIIRIPSMGFIEISTDNRNTFTPLMEVTAYLYDEWKDFSADSGDWFTEIIDLSEYEDDTVIVRFRLNTNNRTDIDGWYIDNINIGSVTGIDTDTDGLVQNYYDLKQNYPNPFNPSTMIQYSIPVVEALSSSPSTSSSFSTSSAEGRAEGPILSSAEGRHITIKVYDILGKEVATLINKEQHPGHYEVKWDAAGQASGMYFYRLKAGNYIQSKKMVLIK